MGMVFCRGCGKEIHETATMCPHCGYQYAEIRLGSEKGNLWMAAVSSVLALLSFLNWFNYYKWDHDMKIGLWLFCIVSVALSSISLSQKHRGKILNYLSIGVSAITILLLIAKI